MPEIQRDYVWGHKNNCEKVLLPFLESLNHHLEEERRYNIGFLYSYTNSTEDNYIIDGQQRFTTIVLLLYVLSVREGLDFSSFIHADKPTMRFTYNVRPQTEIFMRRLFASGKLMEKEIRNQTWFLPEYDSDITITSIINSVEKIAVTLPTLSNISYDKVLNRVCFWYFNVEETSQGGELYITMNSRGQRLTDAEQLKPYLFDKWQKEKSPDDATDYGKLWDDWEEMFYLQKGDNGISAVDNAMNTFLRIVYEMETKTECRKEVPKRNSVLSLPLISRYMEAMLGYAQDEWPKLVDDNLDYRRHRVLKALIAEGLKSEHKSGDIQRVKHVFNNIVNRRKYNRYSHNDLLELLSAYSRSPRPFYDFVIAYKSDVIDEHERDKIRIYKAFEDNVNQQQLIETAFEQMESSKVWSGNISPLISWSLPEENNENVFDLNTFTKYSEKFEALFGDAKLEGEEMDRTRRAMLAFGFIDYPRIFHGNTNTCFAKEPKDWHTLLLDERNVPILKDLLNKYDGEETLEEIIKSFPIDKDFSEFVHIPELLDFCKQKNLQWWNNSWYLIKETRSSSQHANIHTYKYYLSRKDSLFFDGWKNMNFWPWGDTCIYLDQHVESPKHIAIDAYWNGGKEHKQMAIEVFMRPDDGKNEPNVDDTELLLKSIQLLNGYNWNGQRYVYYFETPQNEEQAFSLMDEQLKHIINHINETIINA